MMPSWVRVATRPVLMLAGLVVVGLVLRWAGLDSLVHQAGEHGMGAFLLLAVLAVGVGVPRQVAAYAGGLAFGFWVGAGLSLVAMVAGCAGNFLWARLVARRYVADFLARGGRVARLERFLVANTFSATVTLRLLPVGNNLLLNLLAGVSGAGMGAFVLGSAVGYVPQTVIFALLGSGTRVSQGMQMVLGVVLLAASVLLGVVMMRRRMVPQDAAPPESSV